MQNKNTTRLLIKNIDGNQSLYFLTNSNSGKNALDKLNQELSTILELQKNVEVYEQVLNDYKETITKIMGDYGDCIY